MSKRIVSGIMLTLLLMNILALTFSIQPARATNTTKELIINGGFETGDFTGWDTSLKYGLGNITISSENPHYGTYSAYILGNCRLAQFFSALPASSISSIAYWIRAPALALSVNFFYSDGYFDEFLVWGIKDYWQKFDVTSYLNASNNLIGIGLWGWSNASGEPGWTYVDDVSITFLVHDIATTNITISKTVIGQGYSVSINITVGNHGDCAETFNLTAYANTTVIRTQTVDNMLNGTSTVLTFTWNTTDIAKGNYTISALADTVLGENDTTDNTLIDGWVIVAMVGDISSDVPGVPDGKVDMVDMWEVAKRFGLNYPDPRFVPNYDVDGDTKIDMVDMWIVAKEFGKTDP